MSDAMSDGEKDQEWVAAWQNALVGCHNMAEAYNKGANDMRKTYKQHVKDTMKAIMLEHTPGEKVPMSYIMQLIEERL